MAIKRNTKKSGTKAKGKAKHEWMLSPTGRLSHPKVFQKDEKYDSYRVGILYPKDGRKAKEIPELMFFHKKVMAAAKDFFKGEVPESFHKPYKDGDKPNKRGNKPAPGYWIVQFGNSFQQPGFVDRFNRKMTCMEGDEIGHAENPKGVSPEELYGGCDARVMFRIHVYNGENGPGAMLIHRSGQKVGDNERFGEEQADAQEDFAKHSKPVDEAPDLEENEEAEDLEGDGPGEEDPEEADLEDDGPDDEDEDDDILD
jgi:hypothetical protein